MKICVYCASSQTLDPQYYALGERFGRLLVERGHSLVYGGYSRGLMAAVARGVASRGGEITAVVPRIFDRPGFTFAGCNRVIFTESMHARKAAMEAEGDAFAILPGGIGTFDEAFELYVLKSLNLCKKPMGFLNAFGCYDLLKAFLEQSCRQGLMTEANLKLGVFYETAESLLEALEG